MKLENHKNSNIKLKGSVTEGQNKCKHTDKKKKNMQREKN